MRTKVYCVLGENDNMWFRNNCKRWSALQLKWLQTFLLMSTHLCIETQVQNKCNSISSIYSLILRSYSLDSIECLSIYTFNIIQLHIRIGLKLGLYHLETQVSIYATKRQNSKYCLYAFLFILLLAQDVNTIQKYYHHFMLKIMR